MVDIENSDQCVFIYPFECKNCRCINGKSIFKSEVELKSCQPCQFKSIGWLRAEERRKCSPEICPLFFPQSCGLKLLTAKYLANYMNESLTGGLWISLIGDSQLRGIFIHAASFLSIRSSLITVTINSSNHYDDFFVCCSAAPFHANAAPDISRCILRTNKPARGWILPRALADDFAARTAARQIPICVSFQFAAHATGLHPLFDEHEAAYQRTGIRPAAISINPGLHSLLLAYDLDRLVDDLRVVQRRCAELFANASAASAPPPQPAGPTCLLHTTAYTSLPRRAAVARGHVRTYSNIRGYNAATAALWVAGGPGMPIVDSGALSLVPAVSNSVDGDGIHFRAEGNPFYQLGWQMVLHSALTGGAPICERRPGGRRGGAGA
jgi:hypothetical protein